MSVLTRNRIRFGPFELDPQSGELFKFGHKLKLQGHPIQILAMLLERSGELITREEIQQRLWPTESETFVDFEHGLSTAVRKLRQALGDEADTPQYIETLPRRGYRFVGSLTAEGDAESAAEPDPTNASDSGGAVKRQRRSGGGTSANRLLIRPVLVIVLLPVLLGVAVWMLRGKWRSPPPLQVIATKQITLSGMLDSPMGTGEFSPQPITCGG